MEKTNFNELGSIAEPKYHFFRSSQSHFCKRKTRRQAIEQLFVNCVLYSCERVGSFYAYYLPVIS